MMFSFYINYVCLINTINERIVIYEKGMRACSPEYSVGHSWWDIWENVYCFGDPDLRAFVPNTDYSDVNHWTQEEIQPLMYDKELTIDGHMLFGAASYLHESEPASEIPLWIILFVVVVVLIIIVAASFVNHNKSKKK